MAKLIRMPEIAANASHAVLVEWIVNDGDQVAAGDCIAGIETDKAVVDLEAEDDGTMGPQLVAAGANVAVGAVIGVLLGKNESKADADALLAKNAALARADLGTGIAAAVDTGALPGAASPPAVSSASVSPAAAGRIFASPRARFLAREQGVDLAGIIGSGPNGRIVKCDVEKAAADSGLPHDPQAAVPPPAAAAHDIIPHTGMRKTIARRLTESKTSIPHFYLNAACRMDALLALRAQVNDAVPRRISINDFIIKAVACALRDVPDMNVVWTDEAVHRYRSVDIAIAVSTDGGLITPVVRAAESKTLSAISATMAELAERARAGQLGPAEYQGGTFSISNLGMYGVSDFTAIINPPQSAILAVGTAQKAPVVVDDAVCIATIMRCTLSVDHRVIDGALAARWLALFKQYMENPASMLV